jgi:hypothetical protein
VSTTFGCRANIAICLQVNKQNESPKRSVDEIFIGILFNKTTKIRERPTQIQRRFMWISVR